MTRSSIMIVDDEVRVLKALERELNDFAEEMNVEIVFFESPVEALEEIRAGNREIAMVISDQKMPQMKGFEFLADVRKEDQDILFILLTAYADIEDAINTIRTGLFSYVMKPWDIDQLRYEMSNALALYRLRRENRKNEARLNAALKWGGEIQKKLLECPFPSNENIRFEVEYVPMPQYACGGDYYDVIPVQETQYLAIIGDVSGHGVKAAFITFILKTLVNQALKRPEFSKDLSPSALLKWLNDRLCLELEKIDAILVTICACLIDPVNKKVTVSNAGHIPPRILRGGKILRFPIRGTAMGFMKGFTYEEHTETLHPGDKIILFTDGLAESNDEILALEKSFFRNKDQRSFTRNIIAEAASRTDDGHFSDDVAIMTVEIKR